MRGIAAFAFFASFIFPHALVSIPHRMRWRKSLYRDCYRCRGAVCEACEWNRRAIYAVPKAGVRAGFVWAERPGRGVACRVLGEAITNSAEMEVGTGRSGIGSSNAGRGSGSRLRHSRRSAI